MVNDEIDAVPSGRNSLGVTGNACDIRRWVTEHENSRQFKIKTHRQRDKKAGMEGDRSRDGRREGRERQYNAILSRKVVQETHTCTHSMSGTEMQTDT